MSQIAGTNMSANALAFSQENPAFLSRHGQVQRNSVTPFSIDRLSTG
jgi:hypothetical protein